MGGFDGERKGFSGYYSPLSYKSDLLTILPNVKKLERFFIDETSFYLSFSYNFRYSFNH